MITKVLINKEGRFFYVREDTKVLHTEFGMFSAKELKKNKGTAKTNTGSEFFIFPASFHDRYRKLKRGAQIITPKDAGLIITTSGINKESKIVEAGGGSGSLTCMLANLVKKVTTYEKKPEFVKIIKYNVKNLGLNNVTVKNKDIKEGIAEKNVDLIVLDMLDPEEAIEKANNSLKMGGFLVVYLPSITQVSSAVKAAKKLELMHVKTVENLLREWKIDGKIARPEFRMLGHTGFLSFFRKISS